MGAVTLVIRRASGTQAPETRSPVTINTTPVMVLTAHPRPLRPALVPGRCQRHGLREAPAYSSRPRELPPDRDHGLWYSAGDPTERVPMTLTGRSVGEGATGGQPDLTTGQATTIKDP